VVDAASRSPRVSRFVPGHPMAGAPAGGVELARAELFQGRRWLLCPEGRDADAIARVEDLVRSVGAEPLHLGALEHDRAVALTSHVPQLLASAMAVLAGRRDAAIAAGPAFLRLTRGAGGPASMWGDIFSSNADEVAGLLRELCGELERIAAQLEQVPAQTDAALELLAQARAVLDPGV
jgi:prephenate dehydrogenase